MAITCTLIILLLIVVKGHASIHEHVFGTYNKYMQPNTGVQTPTQVNIYVGLVAIDNVDMKQQTVKSRIFLQLQWEDKRLMWNPEEFENVTMIIATGKDIWKPNLIVSSLTKSIVFIKFGDVPASISANGSIELWKYLEVDMGNKMDIVKYPFDKQEVSFSFEDWAYSAGHVLLNANKTDNPTAWFQSNGEWEIASYEVNCWNESYGAEGIFSKCGYIFSIKRLTLYHVLNIICPVVLVSLLNIVCFILPVTHGERVTLSVSIFLTLAVFLMTVNDALPKSSNGVSILIVYLGLQMLGTAFTILMTVCVIRLCQKEPESDTSSFLEGVLYLYQMINPGSIDQTVHIKDKHTHMNKLINTTYKYIVAEQDQIMPVQEKLDFFKRDGLWMKIAISLNELCFWLAIIWNTALLVFLLIFAYM